MSQTLATRIIASYPNIRDKTYSAARPGIARFLLSLSEAAAAVGDDLTIIACDAGRRELKAAGVASSALSAGQPADIWARDWGTVQRSDGTPVSFCYRPSSLWPKEAREIQAAFFKWVRSQKDLPPAARSDLVMDGGNVVLEPTSGRAFVTERVFSDNSKFSREQVISTLASELGLAGGTSGLCVIPEDPGDPTLGHADGSVAFLGPSVVAVNEDPEPYSRDLRAAIEKSFPDVRIVALPFVPHDDVFKYEKAEFVSCMGVYVNSLVTARAVYVPQYGLDADGLAVAKVRAEAPDHLQVLGVDASGVAHMGGSVRCLTMTLPARDP